MSEEIGKGAWSARSLEAQKTSCSNYVYDKSSSGNSLAVSTLQHRRVLDTYSVTTHFSASTTLQFFMVIFCNHYSSFFSYLLRTRHLLLPLLLLFGELEEPGERVLRSRDFNIKLLHRVIPVFYHRWELPVNAISSFAEIFVLILFYL